MPFRGSLPVVAVAALLFAFTSIGQGLIISTLSRTRYQAQQAVMFVVLPSFLLSGFVFPLESMPRPVYLVTYAIPMRYFLVVLRANFMKGSGFVALAPAAARDGGVLGRHLRRGAAALPEEDLGLAAAHRRGAAHFGVMKQAAPGSTRAVNGVVAPATSPSYCSGSGGSDSTRISRALWISSPLRSRHLAEAVEQRLPHGGDERRRRGACG